MAEEGEAYNNNGHGTEIGNVMFGKEAEWV